MRRAGQIWNMVSDRCTSRRASELIFFFQAEDGIRDLTVTGVQTCALPIFIKSELLSNTVAVGNRLIDGLNELAARQPLIRDVRGRGLMIGIEFESPEVADAVELAAFRQGMLTLRCGDATIRMSPPLVMTAGQAATGLRVFEEACAHVSDWGPAAFAGLVGTNEAGPSVPE